MKRILSAALCTAALLSFGQSSAQGELVREVKGTILLPTVQHEEVGPAPVSRGARCAYTLAKEAGNGSDSNGLVGWVVELTEAEMDGEHTMTLSTDGGDPAAIFYSSLATCDTNATTTGDANTDGGEEATIPYNTSHVIIVVEDEADVAFNFSIFAPEEA